MGVNISAKDVNELRKKTGSGMMDCKKALVEAEGNFQNDVMDGFGRKVFLDAKTLIGWFTKNKLHGYGYHVNPVGLITEGLYDMGSWKEDRDNVKSYDHRLEFKALPFVRSKYMVVTEAPAKVS